MIVLVVPSDGMAESGGRSVAPYFIIQANVPQRFQGLPYGFIGRQHKGNTYVDPWKLAESLQSGALGFKATHNLPIGAAEGVGDDGVLRWEIHLGWSGHVVLSGGIDAGDGALAQLFQKDGEVVIPDAIVLVVRQDLGEIRSACEQLDIETVVIDYEGQLALDRWV